MCRNWSGPRAPNRESEAETQRYEEHQVPRAGRSGRKWFWGDEMRLVNRIRQLVRVVFKKRPPSVIERLDRAFDEAAIRITGKSGQQMAEDRLAVDLVMADVGQYFIRSLRRQRVGDAG